MFHRLTGKSLQEEYVSDGDHNEVELVEDRGDQHRGKAGSELPTRLTENQGNIIFQIFWVFIAWWSDFWRPFSFEESCC